MQIEIEQVERLRFDHGGPVRAASAVTGFGNGFLVVQDDATHAAWFVDGRATPLRLLPPVDGLEAFDEPSATKHLKPDFEAACAILDGADPALLVMGSGSSPARMRWVLLKLEQGRPHTRVADMTGLYRVAADALDVPLDALNLEGACTSVTPCGGSTAVCPRRGSPPPASTSTWSTCWRRPRPRGCREITVAASRRYALGSVANVGLAITDAVALPGHGVLCAAAAEDSPNTRDDGPVVASALVLLRDDGVADAALLPLIEGVVAKVEGLMLVEASDGWARLLAVVDGDDPRAESLAVTLRVRL